MMTDERVFWKKEKANQDEYPDPLVKQKDNEPYSTEDFLVCPLLPTIKRNTENKLALHLEKDERKVLTK
jgi:hypothetical protein